MQSMHDLYSVHKVQEECYITFETDLRMLLNHVQEQASLHAHVTSSLPALYIYPSTDWSQCYSSSLTSKHHSSIAGQSWLIVLYITHWVSLPIGLNFPSSTHWQSPSKHYSWHPSSGQACAVLAIAHYNNVKTTSTKMLYIAVYMMCLEIHTWNRMRPWMVTILLGW